MPSNISLIDSLSIKAYGGTNWIAKVPVITILSVIVFIGLPSVQIPLCVFAGVIIYIGILLLIKSWMLLKDLLTIDYVFTILIGSAVILRDLTTGFVLAMVYAGICYFILKQFAWANIAVQEVISTTHEMTVVVKEEDVNETFAILMDMKLN